MTTGTDRTRADSAIDELVESARAVIDQGLTPAAIFIEEEGDSYSLWYEVWAVFRSDGEAALEGYTFGSSYRVEAQWYFQFHLCDCPWGTAARYKYSAIAIGAKLALHLGVELHLCSERGEHQKWWEVAPHRHPSPEPPALPTHDALSCEETRQIFASVPLAAQLRSLAQLSLLDASPAHDWDPAAIWDSVPSRAAGEDHGVYRFARSRAAQWRRDGGLVLVDMPGYLGLSAGLALAEEGFVPVFVMGPHLDAQKDFSQELAAAKALARPLSRALERLTADAPIALIVDHDSEVVDNHRLAGASDKLPELRWYYRWWLKRRYGVGPDDLSMMADEAKKRRARFRRAVLPSAGFVCDAHRGRVLWIGELDDIDEETRTVDLTERGLSAAYRRAGIQITRVLFNPYFAGHFPSELVLPRTA